MLIQIILVAALFGSLLFAWKMYKSNKMYKEAAKLAESDLISDLDDLISKKVAFKYNGMLYHIKALSLEQFFAVTGTLAKLDSLKTRKIKNEEHLMNIYQELFDTAIEEKLIASQMTYQQISALFNLILDNHGQSTCEARKKKAIESEGKLNDGVLKIKIRASHLIGEMCRFYGWTVDDCLSMNARRFFTMLETSRDIKANELKDAADVAAIPMYTKKYHLELIKQFEMMSPTMKKAKEDFHRQAMQGFKEERKPYLEGTDAQNALIDLFAGSRKMVN
jgi:hypothetical protein